MIAKKDILNFIYDKNSGNKPTFLSDSAPYSGLRLAAYKSGNKTWFYRYRHKLTGMVKQVRLGSFSSCLDLDEARAMYKKSKAERDSGLCPATLLKQEKDKVKGLKYTIELMMEDYYCEHVDIKRNKRSSSDFYMICKNTIYPMVGHIPAKFLDLELMTELSKEINTDSRFNAVRVMLGAAFEWAIRSKRIPATERKHTYRIKTKFMSEGDYK